MPRPIRWLHISDLHIGCPGRSLWWQVENEFERSVRKKVELLGVPDLILITGDLTFQGVEEEFARVDQFLEKLLGWIKDADGGPSPIIVPVPGNHDLKRPEGREVRPYRFLDNYSKGREDDDIADLMDELWGEKLDTSFFEPLFAAYEAWFERTISPQLDGPGVSCHPSHFPGDFCLSLNIADTSPLCIVGLNSSWMQYKAGDFYGKLELPLEQFHAALGPTTSPLDTFQEYDNALLLMHHPPTWFSKGARKAFLEGIYTPEQFSLCLHGEDICPHFG